MTINGNPAIYQVKISPSEKAISSTPIFDEYFEKCFIQGWRDIMKQFLKQEPHLGRIYAVMLASSLKKRGVSLSRDEKAILLNFLYQIPMYLGKSTVLRLINEIKMEGNFSKVGKAFRIQGYKEIAPIVSSIVEELYEDYDAYLLPH